ncbi:MAG: RMD1 family protein [Peptococcaceae bacterium]|nr:RMD1 family protein [Peptococcaceae bacterium]
MATINFTAVALLNEIHVNKLAGHFGIEHKFKWEESLRLNEAALSGIIPVVADKSIYVFPFGSIVFMNCEHHEIMDVIHYLGRIEKSLAQVTTLDFSDDYKIEILPDAELTINNDNMITSSELSYQREIVATVLAKSVALERIEIDIDKLLDEIEDLVNYLQRGYLAISDKKLAKMSARILGFRLSTISYIMLLDKPEITWLNEEAEFLFDKLSPLFDLTDRCENIRLKSEMLMDITKVFSELAHSTRGNRLEWGIIVLIMIEIVLSLVPMIFK